MRNLIADLVPNITRLNMPGDEHVSHSGYDGIVSSLVGTPFVPLGDSVWEFGVGQGTNSKADEDYNKRTKDPLGVDKSKTTFVFVTTSSWPSGRDWAKKKTELGEWKNVEVRNSSDLYAALERSPRTHIRFSEELGLPSNGVRTLENWWESYAARAHGLLTPGLLTVGRANEAALLLASITDGAARQLWIQAPDSDEVLTFVASVIKKADPKLCQELLDRALVVFEPGALRWLGDTEGLLILVPFEESLVRQADLIGGHHVILQTSSGPASFVLPRIPIGEAERVLGSLGVEEARVSELARAINKSVALYKQKLTGSANHSTLTVATFADSTLARRAWLLGSWNTGASGDREAITQLTGVGLAEYQEALIPFVEGSVPIFTKVGAATKVFDREASGSEVLTRITAEDLRALEVVMQDILGAVDPKLDLPRDERWRANIDGKVRNHSSDLRKGLSATLAMLGSLEHDEDQVVGGQTLSAWSQMLVRALLERAEEDNNGKLWESLFDVLSLIAEAAPDAFLDAVGTRLRPGGNLPDQVFIEGSDHFFSPTSPHVYIQWALDVLGWSPAYFGQTTALAMQLVQMAPNGKVSNHPLESLTRSFVPWRPQTLASLKSRNRVLTRLAKNHPSETWSLLLTLLPSSHGFITESVGPKFHDWKSQALQTKVTMADYFGAVSHIVDLSLELVQDDPARLVDLVDKLGDLTKDLRERVLAAFEVASRRGDLEEGVAEGVWKELTALTRRHREYSGADWAMDEDELVIFDNLAAKFEPDQTQDRVEWLFEHSPDLVDVIRRGDYPAYRIELRRRQVVATELVFDQDGLDGLLELASKVETPWAVGTAAADSDHVVLDIDILAPVLVSENKGIQRFAEAAIAHITLPDSARIVSLARRHRESALIVARILRIAEDLQLVWDLLPDFGADVERLYWSEFEIQGRGDFELVNEAARRLGKHGRYAVALHMLALYSHGGKVQLAPELVVELLNSLAFSGDPELCILSRYDIETLLEKAEQSGAIDVEQLGLLQWRLLPALDESTNTKALQSLLATSPEFFVAIISYAYRGNKENDGPKTSAETASNAWRLLYRWKLIPGTREDGMIDEISLANWIGETRERLSAVGRLEVGEAHIGMVLAKDKADEQEQIWPSTPVRNFLETDSSQTIDRNFKIGIFNGRDVTFRGLTDGGIQERELADKYNDYANALADEWPKTARLLREVAKGFRDEALGHDEESRRVEEGFDF
ncbi:hypothetical protein [Glutamicibacter endophyticus]|uniref:hypothetical protein n=1 Tax=Glutamicibacter endophyticus TaxID=1522174 RepID=UPI003AF1E128